MKKILVIEDNANIRENIVEILEWGEYKVIAADNGKKGMELAVSEKPDLIICDIMMPGLNGYGVLHVLSKEPETATIPFIFLTAKADRTDMRKGLEMGADDYLTKPFHASDLLSAIESRFRKSDLMKNEFGNSAEGISDPTSQVKLLSDDREEVVYSKKANIYDQGHRPVYLYYVISGKVKTYRINQDGKELISGMYSEGDYFGYLPLLEEQTYQDTAQALEDTKVMLIPKIDFLHLIDSNPDISNKFIKLLANDISERESELLKLAYNSLRKRVADGLLLVNKLYKSKESKNPHINLSRRDLAKIIGTANETLIRTLADFKNEKLIDIVNAKIVIRDEDKLAQMPN